MLRAGLPIVVVLVAVGLAGCAGRSGAAPAAPAPTTTAPAVVVRTVGAAAVIGSLPERSSLLIHGTAPLAPLDEYTKQDLTTLATGEGEDPDDALRDYAAQPAFDAVARAAEESPDYSDAVFHAGVHAASELRFVQRPTQALIDSITAQYPRDLRIEWGDHLVGDQGREDFSEAVFGILTGLPGIGHPSTGIDADGRLAVAYDGTASPTAVADGIVAAPEFQRLLVDGAPPTEVRITHEADNEMDDLLPTR